MIDLDLMEGFRSLNMNNFPDFSIYLNSKEYKMREPEAEFLSGKIRNLFKNDKTANLINIVINKEDVFDGYNIEEERFEYIMQKSFKRILNEVAMIFTNNPDTSFSEDEEMSLEELCCTKAILNAIESKSVKVKEGTYYEVNKENAILILNVVGNEKSIEYVGSHLNEIDIRKIAPNRLMEVLQSDYVQVRGEGDIFRIVKESIEARGWEVGYLLGCVEASLLCGNDLKEYVEMIYKYISETNEETENNNRKRRREVQIDENILESLLKFAEKSSATQERMIVSEPSVCYNIPVNLLLMKNLNEFFKGRIVMSAKTMLNDDHNSYNVLTRGERSCYQSKYGSERGQWIQFDFPEDICATKIQMKPLGEGWNPQELRIEAVNGTEKDLIALAKFSKEDRRSYTFQMSKEVWTKSIVITMDAENYLDDRNRYVLFLYEVIIHGYC